MHFLRARHLSLVDGLATKTSLRPLACSTDGTSASSVLPTLRKRSEGRASVLKRNPPHHPVRFCKSQPIPALAPLPSHHSQVRVYLRCYSSPQVIQHYFHAPSHSISMAGSNPFPFFCTEILVACISASLSLPSSLSMDSLSAQCSFHLCFVWQHFKLSVSQPPLVETFENASRKRKAKLLLKRASPSLVFFPKNLHRLRTLMATFQKSEG